MLPKIENLERQATRFWTREGIVLHPATAFPATHPSSYIILIPVYDLLSSSSSSIFHHSSSLHHQKAIKFTHPEVYVPWKFQILSLLSRPGWLRKGTLLQSPCTTTWLQVIGLESIWTMTEAPTARQMDPITQPILVLDADKGKFASGQSIKHIGTYGRNGKVVFRS